MYDLYLGPDISIVQDMPCPNRIDSWGEAKDTTRLTSRPDTTKASG